MISNRRTGRTTRMLEAAKAHQRETGGKAVVICHSRNYARDLASQHPDLEFVSVADVVERQRLRGRTVMPFYDHAIVDYMPNRHSYDFWREFDFAKTRAERKQ